MLIILWIDCTMQLVSNQCQVNEKNLLVVNVHKKLAFAIFMSFRAKFCSIKFETLASSTEVVKFIPWDILSDF